MLAKVSFCAGKKIDTLLRALAQTTSNVASQWTARAFSCVSVETCN